jgi:hypothetical protein
MLDAIVDLTKARPHLHTTARYTARELEAYHAGYYSGVIWSLRVAEEAIRTFALYQLERRARAKEKRRA